MINYDKRIAMLLSASQDEEVKKQCEKNNISKAEYIRRALTDKLKKDAIQKG